jgi:hypothetical protein
MPNWHKSGSAAHRRARCFVETSEGRTPAIARSRGTSAVCVRTSLDRGNTDELGCHGPFVDEDAFSALIAECQESGNNTELVWRILCPMRARSAGRARGSCRSGVGAA